MSPLYKKYFSIVSNVISAVIVFLISFSNGFKIPDSTGNVKIAGIIIVYIGVGIFIWAAMYLKKAISGLISPRLEYIVTGGPFKYSRHPVYFGMMVAMFGVAISLRSWLGLVAVLLLFLPSEIHRARLEEKELSRKFGKDWIDYVNKTSFFLPQFKK